MKKCLYFMWALVTASFSSSCFAACDGFYLGLQGGAARTHYDKEYLPKEIGPKAREDESGPVGRIFWGYQCTQWSAIELGYAKVKYTDEDHQPLFINSEVLRPITKESETITDLVLKGILPLGCRAGLFAKAGGAYRNINFQHDRDRTHLSPTYGAGLSLDVCPKVPIEVSWTQIHGRGNIGSINMVTFGTSYHFG